MKQHRSQSTRSHKPVGRLTGLSARRRRGALLSAEMLLVFPVLMGVLFGIVELSLLISSYNTMKLASADGARLYARGSTDTAAAAAVAAVLLENDAKTFGGSATATSLSTDVTVQVTSELSAAGNLACVTISMPMEKATPDLLGVIGFTLEGRTLVSRTCMLFE
ncbi:MAG: TadE/TadG family type IV pilus assembly protein [Pirellulaceae bacterium]